MGTAAFSPDYGAARARFRSGALALGCELEGVATGLRGPDGDELTIDIARMGADDARAAVVVSSGQHGVEGFLGSAIQATLLEDTLGGWRAPPGLSLVLIHAINPFGFAWLRRVDAENIDVNRNFLADGEPYAGSPDGYDALDPLLNPTTPPGGFDPFWVQAGLQVIRHGMPRLRAAVAGGQYDYPRGLFYGGSGPSLSRRLLQAHLPRWIGGATRVLHVDVHSGLGKRGGVKLFVDHAPDAPGFRRLSDMFGPDVEPWTEKATSYPIRGGMGAWCKARFGDGYDLLCAEFGTVAPLRVLQALRDENRATWTLPTGHPRLMAARERLKEAFVPRDPAWRETVVGLGVDLVTRSLDAAGA